MIQKIFAKNIKALRLKKNLTQAQLGARAGLSRDGYQKIERMITWVSPENIDAIAKALGVHPTELFKPLKKI